MAFTLQDIPDKSDSVCELYPRPEEETCVCGGGSDVSGILICSTKYAETCPWANEQREGLPGSTRKQWDEMKAEVSK